MCDIFLNTFWNSVWMGNKWTFFSILFGIVFGWGINGVWFGILVGYTIGGLIAIAYANNYLKNLSKTEDNPF